MKRASYRHAVELIAMNDDPAERDVEAVAAQISTSLVADLFGVERERVARVRFRETVKS